MTSRAFKHQFNVDDAYMEDSKAELIQGHWLAVDEAGAVRVWTGGTASIAVPATAHTPVPAQAPLTCMPYHLAEKILAGRPALEGARKQVTVALEMSQAMGMTFWLPETEAPLALLEELRSYAFHTEYL